MKLCWGIVPVPHTTITLSLLPLCAICLASIVFLSLIKNKRMQGTEATNCGINFTLFYCLVRREGRETGLKTCSGRESEINNN